MTINVTLTNKEIEDGKKVLKTVLIDGRETATGFGEYVDLLTPIIAPQHPNAKIKNLRSLVFHRNEDGWFAVFVLKKVRNGLPGVFGTPSDQPCKSRQEAYTKACLTAGLLYNAERLGIKPGGGLPSNLPSAMDAFIFTSY